MSLLRTIFPSTGLLALAILCLVGCKDEAAAPLNLGHSFAPITVGSWMEYSVDSINHNAFTGQVDTFRFQLREVVESEFTDNSGRTSVRIERYKRSNENTTWGLTDVYSATRTQTGYERFEENTRYLRLSFPPQDGNQWDGNAFNHNGEQDYEYSFVNLGRTVGAHSFDSTITVIQENNINLIEIRTAEEHYARNVGLVYKEIISRDLEEDSGIEYFQTITDWSIAP